ncbi:MAG: fimbrillin family protein [Prevotella sp.]|nr:fimbrillin family protein [Prevotella sp.]
MRINQVLYMAGLAMLLAACSSDDTAQTGPDQDGLVPVTLSYTTEPVVTGNRAAAATDLNKDYIEAGKSVTVRISEYGEGQYTDYTYTTGESGALTLPSPAPYYPLDGKNVDILAYYPSFDGTTFTVSDDQTTDAAYAASDLMWATPLTNEAKTTEKKTLTFSHKMAKIVVTATAGTAVSKINSVTLKQIQRTVDFIKTTGEVSGLTGAAGDIKVVEGESAATVSGAAVFPEQKINGRLLAVGVTLTNGDAGTAYYTVDNKTFNEGSVYTLDITVSYPEVEAETAITSWTEGGTANVAPLRPARVGDLYFSDGTWGSAADFPDKTPIGIVFCTPTSAKDQAKGYYQGYVMALKRANSGNAVANWCVSSLQNTQVTDVLYGSTDQPTQWGNITSDMDGLTHCEKALSGRTQSNLTAINAAKTYTPAAPTSTALLPNSGWYLPSIGQQYQWLIAFAGSGTYYSNIKNYGSWTWRSDYQDFYLSNATYSDASGNTATAINTYVQGKLSTDKNKALFESFGTGHYLWSSTERAAGYAFYLNFGTNGNLYLNGGTDKSDSDRQVRAVLAF